MTTEVIEATPEEVLACKAVTSFTALMVGERPTRAFAEALLTEAAAMLGALDGRPALAERLRELADRIEASKPIGLRN